MHQKYTYSQKLDRLLDKQTSVQLAEKLGVSRMSLVNWRNNDASIKDTNKLNIDIEYINTFGFEHITEQSVESHVKALIDVGLNNYSIEQSALLNQWINTNAFGSLEVEESWATREKYDDVIQGDSLNKVTRNQFLSIHNLQTLTKKVFKEALQKEFKPSKDIIKEWHFILMNGLREDAGEFSTKYRVIPKADNITLTDPKDIESEIEYWCEKYQNIISLEEIAKAHTHFELIHPFGDGNGRIGRLIMAAQSISTGIIPANINNQNKALYYVYLYHAQTTGDVGSLTWLLADIVLQEFRK